MSGDVFVPVPQECMGQLIGTKGIKIKEVEQQTHTRIWACKGNGLERECGFKVTGSPHACETACDEINHRMDHLPATINKPVTQKFAHLLMRKQSSENFRQIEQKCNVKITWPKFSGKEDVNFCIRGSRIDCENAKRLVDTYVAKWKENEASRKSEASGSQTDPKENRIKREIKVPKKYIGLVFGKQGKNIGRIKTKSRTTITMPQPNAEGETDTETKTAILIATGRYEDCVRAESLIRECIILHKDKTMKRQEFGGNAQFVCIDISDQNCELRLKQEGSPPKLDCYIRGQRYRIARADGDHSEHGDVNETLVSVLEHKLSHSLEKLCELRDDKQLLVDLWCHLGKIFVYDVEEGDEQKCFKPQEINEQVQKAVSPTKNTNEQASWKVTFEEGVDPSKICDGALPSSGSINAEFFYLKLVRTQWRYDIGFTTPSVRNVRFKAWKGLPPHSEGPPVEVKNILQQVSLQTDEDIEACICYPSATVLKGEIMTPNSQYDCRMKLRAGSRYVMDKDDVCKEEDMILSDYLSHCTFDASKHCVLPEEEHNKCPEGFICTFHREAEERMFSANVDKESFTVIVSDETVWDSDGSEKRHRKQFGIRVVMDSWSDSLLSCERKWKPTEILAKLSDYMGFVSNLKAHLFEQ